MSRVKFVNKEYRMSHLYKIVDYKGQTVVFKRNKAQRLVTNLKNKMKKEKGRVRVIILKSRQMGMTTDSCITNLDNALTDYNRNIIITAHKQDKQKEIFQKVKFAYDNFPNGFKENSKVYYTKPATKLDNVNQLFFKDNNSKIQVTLDARSGTATDIHLTELAFRNDAEEMMAGTLPAAEHADITIETTANGVGNYFHKLRQDNYNNPDGTWWCIFLGRWLDNRYATPLLPGEVIELPEELKHLDLLVTDEGKKLTQEQKKRYLSTWKDLKQYVFQEYPSTPEEAFLNTGDVVRPSWTIKSLITPEYIIDSKYRELRIYNKPSYPCILSADTSEGGPKGDYSSLSIRDINYNLLAFFYGRVPPDKLAEIIRYVFIDLGYIGIIAPERNNTGLVTLSKLKDDPDLYNWIFEEKTLDRKTNTYTTKQGWHTNSKTRPLMLGEYEEAIREGYITEVDERLKSEMFTFVYDNNKKMIASVGCHDDAILGDAIGYQMRHHIHRFIPL